MGFLNVLSRHTHICIYIYSDIYQIRIASTYVYLHHTSIQIRLPNALFQDHNPTEREDMCNSLCVKNGYIYIYVHIKDHVQVIVINKNYIELYIGIHYMRKHIVLGQIGHPHPLILPIYRETFRYFADSFRYLLCIPTMWPTPNDS